MILLRLLRRLRRMAPKVIVDDLPYLLHSRPHPHGVPKWVRVDHRLGRRDSLWGAKFHLEI